MNKEILCNAIIVNEGRRFKGYVVVEGDTITEVNEGTPAHLPDNCEITDLRGAYLLPGAIDTHVHFREPGLTGKATIQSESMAAVAGGVTSFLDMPNTIPAATSQEAIDEKIEIASRTSVANYGFFIGATNDNLDELLRADYTRIPGIKLFMGSSTGNMLVDNSNAIDSLFARFKGVIAVHAEDEATIRANRQWIASELGDDPGVELHSLLRSREACERATRRAIEIARRHSTRLHLLHISTAEEARLLTKGKIDGKLITAETCPHYLTFTAADLRGPRGYVRKCNPAIKSDSDRDELRKAVADGRIDIIATDHAPHRLEEKQGSLFKAASGMPGTKFMLPLLMDMTLGDEALISVEQIAEKTAHNPARLYGIERRGFIREGYKADLVAIGRTIHTLTDNDAVDHLPEGIDPGCRWTPYSGIQLRHKVELTIVNGVRVFNGAGCTGKICGEMLRFHY